MNPIVLIPSRMAALRLPGKPLRLIAGVPLVVHVLRRAQEADVARVVVACDTDEIASVVKAAGGEAVLTAPDHPSGTDRIAEALARVDADNVHDTVINVQGDLPTIEPHALRASLVPLSDPAVDIATLVAEIRTEAERTSPHVVKCVGTPLSADRLRALYFTRATAPFGEGPLYHHIGLYTYRRNALRRFVALPQSTLEKREKLEQLRALEHNMRIDAAIVDTVPLGVDTPEDLRVAEARFAGEGALA